MNNTQAIDKGLGFRARFNIEEHLLDHVKSLGLHISKTMEDTYAITASNGHIDIDALCPPYIKHDGHHFELGQLKRFLKYLHHPIEESLSHARKMAPAQDAMPDVKDARRTAHRMFRHLTTGTLDIPDERAFVADDDHAECHGKVEEDMAIADLWRNESEIGNSDTLPSAIPFSKICPERGFGFKIFQSKEIISPIGDWIKEALSDISDKSPLHVDDDGFLFLSGAALDQLCSRMYNDSKLPDTLKAENFKTRIQNHIQNINNRKNDVEFLQSMASHPLKTKNFKEQMNALQTLTSSALTPVLCSGAMQDVWAYYHVTQRDESPIEGLENDFASLSAVIEHLNTSENENMDSATAQAIAHEFYPLLTFSKKACEILEIPQTSIIDECCMTAIHGSSHTIREKDAELLHTLEKSMNKGHGALKAFAVEGGKSIGNVFMESLHFGAKNWKVFAPLTAGYVYILANPDAQSWMMNAYQGFTPPPAVTPENFDVFQENLNLVADPTNKDPVCHLHITAVHCAFNDFIRNMATDTVGYIEIAADKLTHATGIFPADKIDNIAYSPAIESQFAISARNAVQPISSTFLNINLLQWAAHLSFYGTLISRGFKNGVSGGFASTKGFFGEVANTGTVLMKEKWPAVTAATLTAPTLAMNTDMNPAGVVYSTIAAFAAGYSMWNRKPSCNKALMDLIEEKNLHTPIQNVSRHNDIIHDLADTAHMREELARKLPQNIASKPYSLKLSGALSRKFNLCANKQDSLCEQLENFDFLLCHLSEEIGVNYSQDKEKSNETYKNSLHTKVKSLKSALADFLQDHDQEKLQSALNLHLKDIMGAQIIHTGSDSLYSSLFGAASDIEHHNDVEYLTNHANARLGRHKRAQAILNHGNVIDLYKKQFPLAPERIKSEIAMRSLSLWDDIVILARKVQKTWHELPDFKFKTGDKNASAKNISLATSAGIIALMDMTEMSDRLLDGKALEAFNIASGALGATFSTAVFTTTFAGYNLWDDIILNDMVIGFGACLSAGVTANLAYKRGIKPAWESFKEHIQVRSNTSDSITSAFVLDDNTKTIDSATYIENSSEHTHNNL